MLAEIGRTGRIAGHFARMGIVRRSQFRLEFVSQVVMDICWYVVHVLVFELLFTHADSLAGWSLPQVRVLLGFVFVTDAFWMTWMGANWMFSRDLKNGALDPYRVKPASPIFLYFFQQFSLEGACNLAIAFSYLGYAIVAADGVSWMLLVTLPWAIALAWWTRILLTVTFSIANILVAGSDLARTLEHLFFAVADRPLDIFSRRTRLFFIYCIPMAAVSYLPTNMVLGRMDLLRAAVDTAWVILLGLLTFQAWHWSFRRYESAMG